MSTAPLPPGRTGLPLVGETLAFVKDPFAFVRERAAAHGPVFRTRILGSDVAILVGPEGCEPWLDPALVERDGAQPPHVFRIFGGASLPSLDGDAHAGRKKQVMNAFGRAALESYLPALQGVIAARLDGWTGQGARPLIGELRGLAIEGIARNMVGLERGPELDALVRDYELVANGLGAIPVALPGTPFARCLAARDRIFAFLADRIRERQEAPRDDGLSRLLAGEDAGGATLAAEDAKLELHHVFLAGYIVFAELAGIVQRLTDHPEVRERLRAEIAEKAPGGELTLAQLHGMDELARFVDEVKRITPMLPVIFGKARTTFDHGGYRIPAGWGVYLALTENHRVPAIYPDPDAFDPGRFAPERAEHERHPHAFHPQGVGPIATSHKCAGLDYATLFMQAFTVLLLRGHDWQLASADRGYRWDRIPPEPADGLRVALRARDAGPG